MHIMNVHCTHNIGLPMNHLSVRGVPVDLAAVLKQQAQDSGKSLNQYIIDVLKKQTGIDKQKHYTNTYHDLDHLFGSWSEYEYQAIQGKIESESQIDHELWS